MISVIRSQQPRSSSSESKGESGALFNLEEREILFSRNMYDKIYPASITKIMTGLLVLEKTVTVAAVLGCHDLSAVVGKSGPKFLELSRNLDKSVYCARSCRKVPNFGALKNTYISKLADGVSDGFCGNPPKFLF